MEDYEKKYKEALERAKGFKTQEYKDVAAHIFPELAESEDENIRKAIRTIILSTNIKQLQIVGVSQSDMFAWLEKQRHVEWSEDLVKDVLLSEVLPCFMHGGEADEVVAKLDEVMSTKVVSQSNPECAL